MEPDPNDPLLPPPDDDGEKDPMTGVVKPGWWALMGGVWRWITEPLPGNVS